MATKKRIDMYQEVTDRMVALLEQGVIPWRKGWRGLSSGAYNTVTKRPYSFMNQMLLKHDGQYASFKQWNALGGKIRKGEHPEQVVFWKMIPVDDGVDEDGNPKKKLIPFLKPHSVFHISQVEGVEPEKREVIDHKPIEEAEAVIENYKAHNTIKIEDVLGNEAYYAPKRDYICVPLKEQFDDINEYYSTKFHEMIHSTGHHSRLNRFPENSVIAAFGSEDYSKEELVAEIGAAFLMGETGIETNDTFRNSAAYVQSWLKALKNDKKLIVGAASKAEKAVEYILNGAA